MLPGVLSDVLWTTPDVFFLFDVDWFLCSVNESIRSHPVELVGKELRGYMTAMESIVVGSEGATKTTDTVRNFNQ